MSLAIHVHKAYFLLCIIKKYYVTVIKLSNLLQP